MNRRSLCALLAGLPLIGGLVPKSAVAIPIVPARRQIMLASVRDLLLPAIRAYNSADIELDIQVDHVNDCVLVRGYNVRTKKPLGFAITRWQIDNNVYKASFRANVLTLIEELKYGPIPQGAVL